MAGTGGRTVKPPPRRVVPRPEPRCGLERSAHAPLPADARTLATNEEASCRSTGRPSCSPQPRACACAALLGGEHSTRGHRGGREPRFSFPALPARTNEAVPAS